MHHARAPSKRMGKESVGAGVLNAQLSNSIILFDKERENAPPCAPLRSKEMKHFESGGPFRDCSNVIVFFGFEEARKGSLSESLRGPRHNPCSLTAKLAELTAASGKGKTLVLKLLHTHILRQALDNNTNSGGGGAEGPTSSLIPCRCS